MSVMRVVKKCFIIGAVWITVNIALLPMQGESSDCDNYVVQVIVLVSTAFLVCL